MPGTPQLRSEIDKLHAQVQTYTPEGKKSFDIQNVFRKLSKRLYIVIPTILFFFLLISRPGFILNVSTTSKIKKLSFKKLVISTFIFSCVIFLGIYGYNHKTK